MRTVNFGYAFVTFSHTDEAKLVSLLMGDVIIDNMPMTVTPKIHVDHKDFDDLFKLQLKKNDSVLVDEFEQLRNAKKDLRDFEENIDKDLPSLKKLKQFQEMARDMIEDR